MKYEKGRVNKFDRKHRLKIMLAEARGAKCEECKCDNFAILQVHHIKERAQGGSDEPENLKLLCANCHGVQHYGVLTFDEWLGRIVQTG